MIKRLLLLVLAAVFLHASGVAQSWKLRTNKNGIKVYSREVEGSKFHALRVESSFDVPASRLIAVILDIEGATEWLYSTKSCITLKTVSPSEVFYYSEVKFPWPVSNRDFVAHLKVNQDPATKTITVHAENVSALVEEKKGIVRVKESVGNWTIRPEGKNKLHVSYELRVDPAGSLPAWLVNMLSTKGPYESFLGLKTQVLKPKYANARLSFIED